MSSAQADQTLYDQLFIQFIISYSPESGASEEKLNPPLRYQLPDPFDLDPADWVDADNNVNNQIQKFLHFQ